MIASSFSSFNLSPNDQLTGACLNQLQKQVIQNHISAVAEQIIALEYNPADPGKFLQDDAALKGQLAAFRFLLQSSEDAEEQLRHQALNLPPKL